MSTPYGHTTSSGASSVGAAQTDNYVQGDEYAQGYGTDQMPMTDDGHPDVENVSVGQLIGEVSRDFSTLMRQELELAKAELRAEATKATGEVKAQTAKAGKGAGMLGGAGLAGLMTVVFLSIALWWALSHLVGHSWSALIVAVLWGIVGAILFSVGRKQLKSIDLSGLKRVNPKPEQTVETLQQVPGALKPH